MVKRKKRQTVSGEVSGTQVPYRRSKRRRKMRAAQDSGRHPVSAPPGADSDDPDADIDRDFAEQQENLMHLGMLIQSTYTISSSDLLAIAKDKPDFLFHDVLTANSLFMLAGKPGCKKSWLAYDMVLALVQNRPWLGVQPVKGAHGETIKRRALVLNFDNPAFELGRRFKRLGLKPEDPVLFHSVGTQLPPIDLPPLLQLPLCLDAIMALLFVHRPDIVLIDSLRQAHTGDEASSEDMSRLMGCLRQMTHYGATVLVLHHTRKSAGDKGDIEDIDNARGSSAISAALDGMLVADDKGNLRWSKTRLWEPTKAERNFRVVDDGDTTRVEDTNTNTKILGIIRDAGSDGVPRKTVLDVCGSPLDQAALEISDLIHQGCIEQTRRRINGKQVRVLVYIGESVFVDT